jgi:hypothetical protein
MKEARPSASSLDRAETETEVGRQFQRPPEKYTKPWDTLFASL